MGAIRPAMGVNVNDRCHPFTVDILSGRKTVETRATDSLRPYVGRRVGIVRTGVGRAVLVGFATIGEPIRYGTPESFRADYGRHRVPAGSVFDCGSGGRFGYPLRDVRSCRPAVGAGGVAVSRCRGVRRSWRPVAVSVVAPGRRDPVAVSGGIVAVSNSEPVQIPEVCFANWITGILLPEFRFRNRISRFGFREPQRLIEPLTLEP